jgi:tRNA-Thr(GGU) m(6)t(6)A37 methyltransferase TsaA
MNQDWQKPVTIRPIGVVVSALTDLDAPCTTVEQSCLWIREDLMEGLLGLEHVSHLHITYWQHRRGELKRRNQIPANKELLTLPSPDGMARKGVFTSRTPARPSGLGSCVVQLLGREGNRLQVRGLDAVNGTPILDMKIYFPRYDGIRIACADALPPLIETPSYALHLPRYDSFPPPQEKEDTPAITNPRTRPE